MFWIKHFSPFYSFLHSEAQHKLVFQSKYLCRICRRSEASSGDEPYAFPLGTDERNALFF